MAKNSLGMYENYSPHQLADFIAKLEAYKKVLPDPNTCSSEIYYLYTMQPLSMLDIQNYDMTKPCRIDKSEKAFARQRGIDLYGKEFYFWVPMFDLTKD